MCHTPILYIPTLATLAIMADFEPNDVDFSSGGVESEGMDDDTSGSEDDSTGSSNGDSEDNEPDVEQEEFDAIETPAFPTTSQTGGGGQICHSLRPVPPRPLAPHRGSAERAGSYQDCPFPARCWAAAATES